MIQQIGIKFTKDLGLAELQTLVDNLRVGQWTATSENLEIIIWNYVDSDDFNSFLKLTGM